jgi:predicted O-linked N-acetylglucosamine transferase (SPINDLY family)
VNFYDEKVVYLPHTYQANDRRKAISAVTPSRAENGLPQHGFVFCCFNASYKIMPDQFDCWMKILRSVDDSVLWCISDNAFAEGNLRSEAQRRGVNPERLIFADRAALDRHLARHRLADLFLDTLPYNAHTTASDALWAGVPVLTQCGDAFPGRVATSLLNAIGLAELVVRSRDEYERQAIELATNPARLAAIRRKLEQDRLAMPLFDTELYTRHLEAAYEQMCERFDAALPPDHIVVPDLRRLGGGD